MAVPGVTHKRLLGLLLVAVLGALEVGAAVLAYSTLGWLESFLFFVALLLNVPILLLVLWRPLPGAVVALGLFLVLVPFQMVLGARLLGLQQEADEIVAFAYEHRLRTGEFAADLASYEASRPELMRFIHYGLESRRGGFQLSYSVGSPATSHVFSPKTGWFYVDD